MALESQREAWNPAVSTNKSRGPALAVYPRVAPSVVVVRTAEGHGTGWVVAEDGAIVTTNTSSRARGRPNDRVRTVTVHFGRLEDGLMHFMAEGFQRWSTKRTPISTCAA